MNSPRQLARNRRMVDEFNRKYRPGTPVHAVLYYAPSITTRTLTPATLFMDSTPMVWLEEIDPRRGCHHSACLWAVKPVAGGINQPCLPGLEAVA